MVGFSIPGMTYAAAFAIVFASPALAKPAQCFTTDDGYFSCEFVATDNAGSFEISGEGVSYSLIIEQPGVAHGFVNLGGRNVSLPGRYTRNLDDAACWDNADTETQICAW